MSKIIVPRHEPTISLEDWCKHYWLIFEWPLWKFEPIEDEL